MVLLAALAACSNDSGKAASEPTRSGPNATDLAVEVDVDQETRRPSSKWCPEPRK